MASKRATDRTDSNQGRIVSVGSQLVCNVIFYRSCCEATDLESQVGFVVEKLSHCEPKPVLLVTRFRLQELVAGL